MSECTIPQTVCDAVNDIKDQTERMVIYNHIEAQAKRIAELEAALQRIASAGGLFAEPASGQHAREIARAALEGEKKKDA